MTPIQQMRFAFFAALWALICSCGNAEENISLTWMPSPSLQVRSYAVYYGAASGSYDYRFDVGTNTTATVSNLARGLNYYFVVVTVDSNGDESMPSNEASYSAPDTPLAFSSIESRNGQVVLTWAGVPGKAYQIEFTTDLTRPHWRPLGSVVTALNGVTTFADAGFAPRCYYRIRVVPDDAPALENSRE
jgi:Fibronectin type III domain